MASDIRTCSENGCDKPARKRGRCNAHYERLRLSGALQIRDKDPVDRLWSRIDKNGPVPTYRPDLGACWIWDGATSSGYGRVYFDGRLQPVHHVVWTLNVGTFPEGKEADHLCRVRACCRPSHIEPVTQRVNLLRGASPAATHARKAKCDAGHPLEGPEADLYVHPARPTWRYCRICRNHAGLKYQRKKRAERIVTTTCIVCGRDFSYNGWRRKLCSDDCRKIRTRQISRDFERAKRSADKA